MLTELQAPRGTFQRLCVHNASAALGELTLRPIGEGREEVFASQKIEDRVTQKFQSFVVLRRPVATALALSQAKLRNCRAVRQGALQQRPVPKLVTQALLKLLVTGGHLIGVARFAAKSAEAV
jgi:hypothetical protein